MQKILHYIQQLNARLFTVMLVPATIIYYLFARMFQDSLQLWNSDIEDALPGFPVLPEPYEIPLYLAGYVVIPLVALGLYWVVEKIYYYYCHSVLDTESKQEQQKQKETVIASERERCVAISNVGVRQNEIASQSLAITGSCSFEKVFIGTISLICLIGVGIYFFRPSIFNFVISYFERQSIWHLVWLLFTKRIYVVKIAFVAGIVAILFVFIRSRFNLSCIRMIDTSKTLKRFIPYLFVLLAVITFHPNFPSQEGFTNFIVAPAHELLNGKPLLYETSSVYGILNIYFTAFLFKLGLPVSFQAFAIVLMVFNFAFFVTLYAVLKQWFESRFFAMLGTWCAVVVGFFLLTDPYVTPYNFPGQGAFRQGMYVFVALLLMFWHAKRKKYFRECVLALSAVLLFWNIDTGVYVVLATFAALALDEFIHYECSVGQRIRNIILLGMRQLGYVVAVFFVIHFVNYAVYGSFPNWGLELADISTFNSGYGKLPLPGFGLFELHVVVYASCALWVLSRLIRKLPIHPLSVFFTVYGIFSFQYYIGNSAWSYLNFVSIPMLILVLDAFKVYFIDGQGQAVNRRIVAAAFLGLVTFMGVLTVAKVPTVFAYRDYSNVSLKYIESDYDRALTNDAEYIKKHFSEMRIPMFHFYDGTLLTRAGKINAFYLQNNTERLYSLYDDMLIVFKRQLQGLENQVDEMKPEYIFISNTPDERISEFEEFVKRDYTIKERLKTLNIYAKTYEQKNED